jgi:hypothetical protein
MSVSLSNNNDWCKYVYDAIWASFDDMWCCTSYCSECCNHSVTTACNGRAIMASRFATSASNDSISVMTNCWCVLPIL